MSSHPASNVEQHNVVSPSVLIGQLQAAIDAQRAEKAVTISAQEKLIQSRKNHEKAARENGTLEEHLRQINEVKQKQQTYEKESADAVDEVARLSNAQQRVTQLKVDIEVVTKEGEDLEGVVERLSAIHKQIKRKVDSRD